MSRSLPGNLKCQDLLVDPFSLENPAETGYIESASADTSAEQSCSWCRWMSYHWPHGPSCPLGSDKADHSVFSNLPRLTQVPLLTLNPLGKRHQWAGIQWAYNTVSASNPPGMTSRTQVLQLATKVHSKIQEWNCQIFKISYVTTRIEWTVTPLLLVFLFLQFCQVYPPDPGGGKKIQQGCKWRQRAVWLWKVN